MTKDAFIEYATSNAGLTQRQAEAALDRLKKARAVKYNAHDGYQFEHGAFLDADVLRRAAGLVN